MKKIILFLLMFLISSTSFGQPTYLKMALESTGEIPNWISSLAIAFFDALSPIALTLNIMLSGLMRDLLWVFLIIYLFGLGINALTSGFSGDKKALTPFQFIPKRVFILIFTALFLTIPVKKIYQYTLDPVVSTISIYTTGFMTNVDDNYESCIKHYNSQLSDEKTEAISRETKANLVCPLNVAAKQIDIMMRMGVWFISGAVSEYIGAFFAQFIPYAGGFIKIVGETHAYIAFAIGMFLLAKGWALALEMLWFLISVIMKLILGTILLPFAMFSYAYADEESGFFGKYTNKWFDKVLNLFKNGLLGFLFWCIAIGLLGIFLQMVLNALVFEIPIMGEMTKVTSVELANPNSVFYENGNIKDSVIIGLFWGIYNPLNWPKWLAFLFGLQIAFYIFNIIKSEMEKLSGGKVSDEFADSVKGFTENITGQIGDYTKKYGDKIGYKALKDWIQKKK